MTSGLQTNVLVCYLKRLNTGKEIKHSMNLIKLRKNIPCN